jgi:hypothetical protein
MPNPHKPQGTLTVTPNPLPYREHGTITGTGFPPNTVLSASAQSGPGFGIFSVTTDGGGEFVTGTYGAFLGPTTITVYQKGGNVSVTLEVT